MLSLRRCIAALVVSGAALTAAPAGAADCPNADAQPDDVSVADYAAALLCVVNEERSAWGRAPLGLQRNLTAAAGWHASDMAENDYFAHASPDGETFADRLDHVNFIPAHSDRWRAGENLAAGSYLAGTPAAIVDGWMNSSDHRVNLLDPGFTLAGIGVARGWPADGHDQQDAVTIALDLGWRAPARRSSA